MSKTLPPKINLREGREKKEGETGEEGREEEEEEEKKKEGKQPFNGDRRGKSLHFNRIKTAQFLQGARAASGNVRGFSLLFFQGTRVYLFFLLLSDELLTFENDPCSHSET